MVALGVQGVVVGTPDGKWSKASVSQFSPTDFSAVAKTRLLLFDLEYWTAALALCVSMTALGLTVSQYRLGDLLRTVAILLLIVCAVVALAVRSASALASFAEGLINSPYGASTILLAPFAVLGVVAVLATTASRPGRPGRFATIILLLLATVPSGALIFLFGFSDDAYDSSFFGSLYIAVAVTAWLLGFASLAASLRRNVGRWRLAGLSISGMATLVLLTFMPWLHLGFDETATKAASIALCFIAAIVLAGYAARTASSEVAGSTTC